MKQWFKTKPILRLYKMRMWENIDLVNSIFFAKKMQLEKSLPLFIHLSKMEFSKGKTKPSLEQS
jgi:hypothetical protein